jgi:4-amino-4-deoxy-L-arabinose transferase-like glycosyltransferase
VRRRVISLIFALSLLLCVATAVLWVRSYWIGDCLTVPEYPDSRERQWIFESGEGSVAVEVVTDPSPGAYPKESWTYRQTRPDEMQAKGKRERGVGFMGFGFHRETMIIFGATLFWKFAIVPYWFPWLLFLIPSGARVYRWRRRIRRQRLHQCSTCSYDLTGNTSGVCPECGAVVPGVAVA